MTRCPAGGGLDPAADALDYEGTPRPRRRIGGPACSSDSTAETVRCRAAAAVPCRAGLWCGQAASWRIGSAARICTCLNDRRTPHPTPAAALCRHRTPAGRFNLPPEDPCRRPGVSAAPPVWPRAWTMPPSPELPPLDALLRVVPSLSAGAPALPMFPPLWGAPQPAPAPRPAAAPAPPLASPAPSAHSSFSPDMAAWLAFPDRRPDAAPARRLSLPSLPRSPPPSPPDEPRGKRYPCPHCAKRFPRPSSLATHLHSHTGERPFPCPNTGCGKRFSVLSNLRRHLRVCCGRPAHASDAGCPLDSQGDTLLAAPEEADAKPRPRRGTSLSSSSWSSSGASDGTAYDPAPQHPHPQAWDAAAWGAGTGALDALVAACAGEMPMPMATR
ncbi:hypothetical protein DFJ74DRAFT_659563 [Hyaloraphidium curvatum]|nr:hypothetical protein DFJ74DRAFT_659563 [Hyaloraphidium curvatum]